MGIMFDKNYSYDELIYALNEYKRKDVRGLMTINTLAVSPEGRAIPLVTINDSETGEDIDKPAYYIQTGLHSDEFSGSVMCLYLIEYLLSGVPAAVEILKRVAFYIIPRLNTDGLETAYRCGAAPRSYCVENTLKNGIVPQDVNDDGLVLYMRWQDPYGNFKESKHDRRIMTSRKPEDNFSGEVYYNMVREGYIRDYDGLYIVNGVRDIDLNRSYAVSWKPNDNSPDYPFADVMSRAVAEFSSSHLNIFAGIDFHNGTACIMRPTNVPDEELEKGDLNQILKIGKMAEEITGLPLIHSQKYDLKTNPPIILPGTTLEWFYWSLGISQYLIELGNGFNSAGLTADDVFSTPYAEWDEKLRIPALKNSDEKGIVVFEEWKPFNHPQIGMVEVGGFYSNNANLLDPNDMKLLAPKITEFMLKHASMHPWLNVSDIEFTRLSENISRIRCRIGNIGGFATRIMNAGNYKSRIPIRIELGLPKDTEVVSREKIFEKPNMYPGEKILLEWFVSGDPDELKNSGTIKVYHPKAGRKTFSISMDV